MLTCLVNLFLLDFVLNVANARKDWADNLDYRFCGVGKGGRQSIGLTSRSNNRKKTPKQGFTFIFAEHGAVRLLTVIKP